MRLNRLASALRARRLDLAAIYSLGDTPNRSVSYFTGFSGSGLLVVPAKGRPFLIVPEMEYEKAKLARLKVYRTEKKKRLFEKLSEIIKRNRIRAKKIGIDKENYSLAVFERMRKFVRGRVYDISLDCRKLRMAKDDAEIALIRKACRVTDMVFRKIVADFRFRTEREVKWFIESEIRRSGCELAFPSIVASGKGSSNPHYDRESRIGRGFLLLDFGARCGGYCSDMSRTIYVGSPSERERADYGLLLAAQLRCIAAVKRTRECSAIYATAISSLGEKSRYFIHALGHGLGLDIHEIPSLSEDEKLLIEDRTAFTIEPGIYFEGRYGIRIEDTIIYRNGAVEILTKSPKRLITVSQG